MSTRHSHQEEEEEATLTSHHCLPKMEILEIHLICEIHIPKYRNPLQVSEIHCLKIEMHEIHFKTGNAEIEIEVSIHVCFYIGWLYTRLDGTYYCSV